MEESKIFDACRSDNPFTDMLNSCYDLEDIQSVLKTEIWVYVARGLRKSLLSIKRQYRRIVRSHQIMIT